ncbi:MAG: C1 family peptidase [Chthonomonadales bacterium]|nr:C1 family peptidase [Chthonomonadales bacterium]
MAHGEIGAGAAAGEADLRPRFARWGLNPKRQGTRPTCSVFVATAALEYAMTERRGRPVRLSEEFLNWAANRAAGEDLDGAFFHDLWSGYRLHGICREAHMPYAGAFDAGARPSPTAMRSAARNRAAGLELRWVKAWDVTTGLTIGQMDGIRAALRGGAPVWAGLRWPKQPEWRDGALQPCGPDAVYDGHSVLLVGFRDDVGWPGGGVFRFHNSAGPSPEGLLPYAFAREYTNDAAWIG